MITRCSDALVLWCSTSLHTLHFTVRPCTPALGLKWHWERHLCLCLPLNASKTISSYDNSLELLVLLANDCRKTATKLSDDCKRTATEKWCAYVWKLPADSYTYWSPQSFGINRERLSSRHRHYWPSTKLSVQSIFVQSCSREPWPVILQSVHTLLHCAAIGGSQQSILQHAACSFVVRAHGRTTLGGKRVTHVFAFQFRSWETMWHNWSERQCWCPSVAVSAHQSVGDVVSALHRGTGGQPVTNRQSIDNINF